MWNKRLHVFKMIGWRKHVTSEGSAHDALAHTETEEYEIQTRKLSL